MHELLPMHVTPSGKSDRVASFCRGDNAEVARCSSGHPGLRARNVSGFTLVELIIVMAIVLVLTLLAVPSFQRLTVANRLTTTTNELVGAINVARTEAIKRNAITQFCGSASNGAKLGASCTSAGEVWVSNGGVATKAVTATTGITSPIVLTGSMAAIQFGGQGLGHSPVDTGPLTGLVADISTASLSTDNHRCIRITAGSILVSNKQSTVCLP